MRRKLFILIFIIVVLGGIIYAFNLKNGLFWDDEDWIINNVYLHSISWDNIKFWFTHNTLAGVGLPSNYYRPLLFFTFAINYVISGTSPVPWHLFSNLIHIANAILVLLILKNYLGKKTAFLVALLFAIHPLQTEAVSYISGRGDLLTALFMLVALLLYLKGTLRWKILSVLSMVLAVLSRETGVIFPLLFLVFYISFLSDGAFLHRIKQGLKQAWPYFCVSIIYGILRLTVLNFQNTLNFYTAPNLYSEHLSYRLLTFTHVLADYVRLLFVPTGLHMERSMTVHTSLFQWPVWFVVIILAGLLYWAYRSYRANRAYSGVLLFGIGWFFVALGPVSGVTPINAVIYEHWLYMPMIGFWAVISWFAVMFYERIRSRQYAKYFLLAIGIAYFSFFGYQSIQRNILWGKPIAFFEDILRYEPSSARVNNNLGNLYFQQGDSEKAELYYEKATSVDDVFPQPHFNIGSIRQSRGDLFGAIQEYETAIRIDPKFHFAYQNLIAIYAQQGNFAQATKYVEILKQLRPDDPRVFYNAALIALGNKEKQLSIKNLEHGLEIVGNDAEAERLIRDLLEKLK